MLQANALSHLVDVRSLPGSRRYPHVDAEALQRWLPEFGIRYHRIAELGGRRNRSHDLGAEVNAFWQNQSFHNYADYALSEPFRSGIEQLLTIATAGPTAVMCSEAVGWRCHRRIIADHLLARGIAVSHIMTETRTDAATLTPGATIATDGTVTYPA